MTGLRAIACLLVVLGLSACQAIAPLGTLRTAAVAGAERPEQAPHFNRLPYDQLVVRINGGQTGRMLLAREEQGVQQWLASDGKAFWIRDGRIVASRGLRDDLHGLHALADLPSPVEVARRADTAATTHPVYAQAADAPETGLVLEYELLRAEESLAIQVDAQVRRLQQVEERVYHPASGARWSNEYWVDTRSGRVIISAQKLPGAPYQVRLEGRILSATQHKPPLPQAVQEVTQ